MHCIHEKKGILCGNKAVYGSKYCHIKSHYPTEKLYNDVINNITHIFQSSRINMEEYHVHDIDEDGACCYRSLAQSLFKHINTIGNKKVITDYFEKHDIDIKKNEATNDINKKPLCYQHETILAKYIQDISKKWLINNSKISFPDTGETIEDMILLSHGLPNMKIYDTLFSKFAGDEDFIDDDDILQNENYDDEFIDIMSKLTINDVPKSKSKSKKYNILDRWGGTAELYAVASFFGISVKVYILERLDKRNLQIYQTTSRSKVAKLKLIQELRPEKIVSTECIELLLSSLNCNPHYQVMFKKTGAIN